MPVPCPTLHMFCGKIAAGKSTLAARLAGAEATVLITEDDWLHALFAGQMSSGRDYMACAARLQAIMGPHVSALLGAGLSVVLDFPANTVAQRAWMRAILAETGAAHRLHVLDVPDAVCLARLHARNARGDHPFAVTDALFHRFTGQYAEPTPDEGFTVLRHRSGG